MSENNKTYTRFVSLPVGMEASTLVPCFKSLAADLEKLRGAPVVGFRIDTAERKLLITFEGEDPFPRVKTTYDVKQTKDTKKKN